MKKIFYIGILICLSTIFNPDVFSQNCNRFHLSGTCMQYPGSLYKIDSQSRSNVISIDIILEYYVIFYGQRDYKLILCTSQLFNPVHFILTDTETKEIIYDSKSDDFTETVELGIENTRRIKIEISVLALNSNKQTNGDNIGCVGFVMHYKPMD